MTAALASRCGKTMHRGGLCCRPAGHLGSHEGEASFKRKQERHTQRRREGAIAVGSHGYAGYTEGCRCDTCRAAKARYMAARRAAAAAAAESGVSVSGITHGTLFAYEERGCRCQRCCEHHKAKRGHRRKASMVTA